LRQPVHVDRDPLAILLARQRFEQVNRAREIILDRRFGGGVIELLDLGDRVHRRAQYKGSRVAG